MMCPVSDSSLKSGDLVLFKADMVHRGDACLGNKTLLFFHARPNTRNVEEEDLQFHAGSLGSLSYGHSPRSVSDKNCYYTMIRMHDESVKGDKVPLRELIGDKVK